MKSKWFIWLCYWVFAVCATYVVLYLGRLELGKPHSFQDLWDQALASGTGLITARYFLGKFGILNTAGKKQAEMKPPVV